MKKLALMSVILLAASHSLQAQEDKFASLDSDSDSRISVEEAASDPSLSAVFADLDVNKDGYLTASELAEN